MARTGRELARVACFLLRGDAQEGDGISAKKRGDVRPTHEWELLLPLFEWPEQERYEEIRPLVLFDVTVSERAGEVGVSESTLYRRLDRFAEEGMESLFDAPAANRKQLPPAIRRLVVDLRAEYPRFNLNEIANIVHVCFGRRPEFSTKDFNRKDTRCILRLSEPRS